MNEKELLNMAAKALGHWDREFNCPNSSAIFMGDPLESNADAFRLAVQLRLCVNISDQGKKTSVVTSWSLGRFEEDHGDPFYATRRAIVRAAAAIGEMSNASLTGARPAEANHEAGAPAGRPR